jgi:hypothetical protein
MTDPSSVEPARLLAAGRAATGLTLLIHPDTVLKAVLAPADQRSVVAHRVVRILGARLFVQAVIEAIRPTRTVLNLGAAVDGIHALTAVGLAALGERRWRRGALLNTATATAFCVATVKTEPRHDPRGARDLPMRSPR